MTGAWTPPADTWGTSPESPPGDWGASLTDEMTDLAARNRTIEDARAGDGTGAFGDTADGAREIGSARAIGGIGTSVAESAAAREMWERLGELRSSFDRSFADPPREQVVQFHDLLAVSVAGRRYALRLSQSAGLFPNRRVTPLPGPISALLGVAGFRGSIVPVYSLAAVLGQPPRPESRWLVLAAGDPAVALAFEELDGHLRIPAGEIIEEQVGHGPRGCLRGIVQRPEGARPIVDVAAVRAAIQALTQHT
ncbi:purine-binding chemotaxis protein CheW [Catenuloplanes nepalensis]|uniref:Purine-binding chemotaxis protein CheW n=1 Tax=Catenuloplanes nepalensis TaxID=587533 RepID=A0ABT9MTV7_9ACTN|nr:chemotaxis protein CheW [Catenuloplanes nepalensis]MDP9794835.1 purine-binding chemotaxis protein CheW [Catenuloplanes nepalensis]